MRWILLIVLCLAGCGRNDDGASSKPLFSSWTRTSDSSTLDFTGGSFNTPLNLYVVGSGGQSCNPVVTVTGSESSGTAVIVYPSGRPGYCPAIDLNYTYTKFSTKLVVCTSGSCGEYR